MKWKSSYNNSKTKVSHVYVYCERHSRLRIAKLKLSYLEIFSYSSCYFFHFTVPVDEWRWDISHHKSERGIRFELEFCTNFQHEKRPKAGRKSNSFCNSRSLSWTNRVWRNTSINNIFTATQNFYHNLLRTAVCKERKSLACLKALPVFLFLFYSCHSSEPFWHKTARCEPLEILFVAQPFKR